MNNPIIKSLAFPFIALVLSGCFQITMEENLNIDGTSSIKIKTDLSAMLEMTKGMSGQFNYESCQDPKLLEKYEVEDFLSPVTKTDTIVYLEETTCEETDVGKVKITLSKTPQKEKKSEFSMNIQSTKSQSVTVSAIGCDDPELLIKNDTDQFPVLKERTQTLESRISCDDSGEKVSIKTEGIDVSTGKSIVKGTQSFSKSQEETKDQCQEETVNHNLTPYDYVECKNIAPGVTEVSLEKKNTDMYTIEGRDLIYDISSLINPLYNQVNGQSDQDLSTVTDPGKLGMEFTYRFISPWEITNNTAGTLIDSKTLEIDLLKVIGKDDLTVTLKDAAQSLAPNQEIPIRLKAKILEYLKRHEKKVSKSKASAERKVAYYQKMDEKFKSWAGNSQPKQRVYKYLSQKIRVLKQTLSTPSVDTMSDNQRSAEVRNIATITKTARAIQSIDSFDSRTFNIAQILKQEAGYDLSQKTEALNTFAFGSNQDDFFILSCGSSLFVDGTNEGVLAAKSVESQSSFCEEKNLEGLQIPGYIITLGSNF